MLKSRALIAAVLLILNIAAVAQSRPVRATAAPIPDECAQDPSLCAKLDPAHDANTFEVEPAQPVTSIRINDASATDRTVPERPSNSSATRMNALPVEPPTEFQTFVESSLGKRLPLFGYNLFQGVPSTFAPVDRIPVPADYVIGPSDELVIRAWGQIDIDAHVVVDRDGQVYLPKVGSVSVAGVRYEQLSKHLEAAVGRVFRNFNLAVSLGRLRSIQIFVVGYARRPGVYTISSLSTMVNALFASGGPSARGSMRHIQLKRANQVISDFDLYDLLLKGDKTKDVILLPGDVIYIPPVGPQVALAGSVTFPAIYELHSTATLAEELDVAGGITTVADGDRVIVERIDNHTTRKVEEFKLDENGKARELRDGDLVRVFSISPKFENAITLRGNVSEPGRYPFRPGMRICDLIPDREFLLTRGFWRNQNDQAKVALAASESESPLELEPPDETGVRRQRDVIATAKQRRFDNDWHSSSSVITGQAELRNDVKRNAPDINWDYAVIQRVNPVDLSTVVIPFNLGKAILEGSEADNIPLQPGDVVTIFSQHDIAVPNAHRSKFVRLEGEFRALGVYKVNPGETLRSLIGRAGGLTDHAFIYGAQFTRESAQKQQQASLDQMVRDLELEAQHQAVYSSTSRPDQQMNIQAQLESQRSLIDKLREVKATGRVVLEIKPSDGGVESFPELAMEDGDRIVVPHKPSTVSVVGSVYNQNSFLYEEKNSVRDYLKSAGGGTRDADMKHVFVIRADGSVLSKTNTSGFWSGGLESVRVVPGDTIVIPAKLDKGSTLRAFKDWSQVISQFGLGAAAINILR
jgi:protein involved in polysaccharide export with SLBB domain